MDLKQKRYSRGCINLADHVKDIERLNFQFLNELPSNFALIFSDSKLKFAAVDRIASIPIYYRLIKGELVLSENVRDLHACEENELDFEGFHNCTGYDLSLRDDKTPFKAIKKLLPGTYIFEKKGKVVINEYWKFTRLDLSISTWQKDKLYDKINSLISESVDYTNALDPSAYTHLSGGVDSSLITLLMSKSRKDKLHSYSFHSKDRIEKRSNSEEYSIYNLLKKNPRIECTFISELNDATDLDYLTDDPGNWFFVGKSEPNAKIVNHLKNGKSKTILTGLGGDELLTAKYNHQNLQPEIKSEFHLNRYNLLNGLRREYGAAKVQFKNFNNRSFAFFSNYYRLRRYIESSYSNYSTAAVKRIKRNKVPNVSLGYDPLSLDMRMRMFNRIHFTTRSDKWNFIGEREGVTFVHPLLSKGILEFVSNLPLSVYKNLKSRELFYSAIERKFSELKIPETKLPSNYTISTDLIDKLQNQMDKDLEEINQLQNTKARYYINFHNLKSVQLRCKKIMVNGINYALYPLLFSAAAKLQLAIAQAKYINSYVQKT